MSDLKVCPTCRGELTEHKHKKVLEMPFKQAAKISIVMRIPEIIQGKL